MATYEVTGPDGTVYEVTGPEGASDEQVLSQVQAFSQPQAAAPPETVAPPPTARPPGRAPRSEFLARKEGASWEDRLRVAGQGLTFGTSDEIASAGAAAILQAMGRDETFAETYKDIMQSSREKRKKFSEDFPVESAAIEMAGGLATGGLGLAKATPMLAKSLAKKVPALATKVGGVTGAGVAAPLVVGAGEGAIYGGASAKPGERLAGAKTGAKWGAGTAGLMGGAGAVGKKGLGEISKRRIAQDLITKEGDQMPISMADPEGALGSWYRNALGTAYGGGALKKQAAVIGDKAEAALTRSDDALRNKAFTESLPTGAAGKDLDLADPTRALEQLRTSWDDSFQMVKKEQFNIDPQKMIDDIAEEFTAPVMRDQGAAVTKTLKAKLGQRLNRGVDTLGMTQKEGKGTMSGEDLMEVRNWFKRNLPTGETPEGKLTKAAYLKAADTIDDQIRKQLSVTNPQAAAAFTQELENYGKYSVLRKAMKKGAATGEDAFTTKQLLSAATAGGGERAARRAAPFQQEAAEQLATGRGLQETMKRTKQATKEGVGGVQKAAQTYLLGSIPAAGSPLAVPIGAGIAAGLTRPGVQRAVAGQTKAQEAATRALRRYEGSEAQDAMRVLGRAVRTPILLEED